jgi:hypothetical protein
MTLPQNQQEYHESMVRRVEAALKALDSNTSGRSQQTGMARALQAALREVYDRMDMAWAVLKGPSRETAAEQKYLLMNASEIGLCYTLIHNIYDELCELNVISKADQIEPTTKAVAQAAEATEKAGRRAEKKVRLKIKTDDGKEIRVRVPLSEYEARK